MYNVTILPKSEPGVKQWVTNIQRELNELETKGWHLVDLVYAKDQLLAVTKRVDC